MKKIQTIVDTILDPVIAEVRRASTEPVDREKVKSCLTVAITSAIRIATIKPTQETITKLSDISAARRPFFRDGVLFANNGTTQGRYELSTGMLKMWPKKIFEAQDRKCGNSEIEAADRQVVDTARREYYVNRSKGKARKIDGDDLLRQIPPTLRQRRERASHIVVVPGEYPYLNVSGAPPVGTRAVETETWRPALLSLPTRRNWDLTITEEHLVIESDEFYVSGPILTF